MPDGQNADEVEDDDEDSVHEEIEKQPLDLEDMLELFREPEEPPRKGFNPMWLVFGLVVVVGGCWLAVVGVGAFVEQMTGLQGGTPKAGKSGERVTEATVNVDVQTAFRERCAKGMSKDEIRWILQDFEKLGLMEELESIGDIFELQTNPHGRDLLRKTALKVAKREREWLVAALAEGLMLDDDQKAEMKQKLADALADYSVKAERAETIALELQESLAEGEEPSEERTERVREAFSKWMDLFPEIRGVDPPTLGWAYCSIALPQLWLNAETYAPWNLCQLSPEQLALTNHKLVSARHGENATEGWLITPEIKDAKGEDLKFPEFLDEAASILPFTTDQAFPRDENGMPLKEVSVEALTKLHPAQFKLLLLCDLELAEKIRPLLEKE